MRPERNGPVWHGYLAQVVLRSGWGSATATGSPGPDDPTASLPCNVGKLLLDPYGNAIDGHIVWDEALFLYWYLPGTATSGNDV